MGPVAAKGVTVAHQASLTERLARGSVTETFCHCVSRAGSRAARSVKGIRGVGLNL